jgi:tetratricopeptide (TPR) repeat protein
MEAGEMAQARQNTKEALAIYQDVGHFRMISVCHVQLGELARIEGDYETAAAHHSQILAIDRELGLGAAVLSFLFCNMGMARLQAGEYEEANELFYQSLTLARQQSDQHLMALTIAGLAGVVMQRGHVERAASLLAAVAAWHEQAEVKMDIADRMDFDRLVAKARTQLTEEAFATAWNEGSVMLLEQAEALALS